MVAVKTVIIERAEGLVEECIKRAFTGNNAFEQANQELLRWSETAPKDGCYNKCDFWVEWEDNQTYKGRYDLTHWTEEIPNLGEHMRDYLEFHAGTHCPDWLQNDRARYEAIVNEDLDRKQNCAEFLNTYQIG